MNDFIQEIRARRVLPAIGVYAAGCWVLIEILDRLVQRYFLSPYITDVAFWGLYSLIPAVVLVSWSHGKPGKDRATRAEKVGVPINVIATLGLLITAFGGKDLGATASVLTIANEEGVQETHYVPSEQYRRRMAVFFFDNPSANPEIAWARYAVTELLVQDLQQNPFVLATSPWANFGNGFYARIRAAGFNDGLGLPRSLMRKIADDANRQYFVDGEIDRVDGQYQVIARVWETERLQRVAELKQSGFDLYAVADRLSEDLREALDVPAGNARLSEDLPLIETYGESEVALRAYIDGLNERLFTNDVAASNAFFDQALEADPNFVLAWFVKALNLLEAGDIPSAQTALARAQELDYRLPINNRSTLKQINYRLSGQQDKLLSFLRLQVHLRDDAASHVRLANMLMAMGELEEAKQQFLAGLDKDPLNLAVFLDLATLERATGDREAAIAYARRYQQEKPGDADAHVVLGDLLRDHGELDKAQEHYLQASMLADEPVISLLRMADLAARKGKTPEARALIEQADQSTKIPLNKGLVRQAAANLENRLGRLGSAIEQIYEQKEFLSQSLAPYQVALATYMPVSSLHVRLGEIEQAQDAVDQGKTLVQPPLDRFLSFSQAMILIEQGEFEAADEALASGETVIDQFKLEDMRFQIDLVRAQLLMSQGNYAGAIESLRSAHQRIERSVLAGNEALVMLPTIDAFTAGAMIHAGDFDGAESMLDHGFSLDSSEPLLWLARARLQKATGSEVLALASVNYALAIWKDADSAYQFYRDAKSLQSEISSAL